MTSYNPKLSTVSIVIADKDAQMAGVLRTSLRKMGFNNIRLFADGRGAYRVLKQKRVDLCITEWDLEAMNGVELIRKLRKDQISPNRVTPIMMLTGRAERADVEAVRDAGATEFVVKPYTVRSVFRRLQQIIDLPRAFIITPTFTGPDRRRKDSEKGDNRRVAVPEIVSGKDVQLSGGPKLILPDYHLRKKLGLTASIQHLITPVMLNQAQAAINNLQQESLSWIQDDLSYLENSYAKLKEVPSEANKEAIMGAALSIKSRAGTFGYAMASNLAYQLYRFMRDVFHTNHAYHDFILIKHIQALKIIFAHDLIGDGSEMEQEILQSLQLLINRIQR